jgi:hypothetical protein
LEFHEVADIFPLMSADEFSALKADIEKNGLIEPIWTYENKIIDGRNRYRACTELGIEPRYREWQGKGYLIDFVVSLNLKRRHLTSSQLAVVALEVEKYLAEKAKKNQLSTLKQNTVFPNLEKREIDPIHSAEMAGEMVGVSHGYVSEAKKLQKEAPDLLEEVRTGKINIARAAKENEQRKVKPKEPVSETVTADEASAMLMFGQIKNAVEEASRDWLLSSDCRTYFRTLGVSYDPVEHWARDGCRSIQEVLLTELRNCAKIPLDDEDCSRPKIIKLPLEQPYTEDLNYLSKQYGISTGAVLKKLIYQEAERIRDLGGLS